MSTPTLWDAAWAERPRLLRIARRRSVDAHEAEDVVQEAMVRCVTHPGIDPDRLAGMLTAVTMRLCVDRLRGRLVAERATVRQSETPPDPLETVLDRAEAAWLAAEAARLVGREHAALVARAEGLSVRETADLLGITYKAAESALDRARRKLRAVWASTLGVLGWVRARSRGSAVTVTVAGGLATVTLAGLLAGQPETGVLPVVRLDERTVLTAATRPAKPMSIPTLMPPGPAPSASHPAAGPVRLRTRPVTVGPVSQEPVTIEVDLSEPLPDRVLRCAANGMDITVTPQQVGAVCREDS